MRFNCDFKSLMIISISIAKIQVEFDLVLIIDIGKLNSKLNKIVIF